MTCDFNSISLGLSPSGPLIFAIRPIEQIKMDPNPHEKGNDAMASLYANHQMDKESLRARLIFLFRPLKMGIVICYDPIAHHENPDH